MTTKVTAQHGFEILRKMQGAKHQFDAGGRKGHISFIKAMIFAGTNYPLMIVAEAARITGDHIRDEIELIIDEGENIHWVRNRYGELHVIGR